MAEFVHKGRKPALTSYCAIQTEYISDNCYNRPKMMITVQFLWPVPLKGQGLIPTVGDHSKPHPLDANLYRGDF
jgi:hypothetical protein